MPRSRFSAHLAFLALGTIWGSNFLFMKWAAEWITPGQVTLLRVVAGFIPLALYAACQGVLRRAHWRHLHHFVVMALLATALYYLAFAYGSSVLLSSVAGMLSGAIPLFTFVAAALFLRNEPINARSITATLLGIIGIALIARPWQGLQADVSLAGVAAMLGGAMCVGLSFVYAKRFVMPLAIPSLALATYQTGIATLLLLAVIELEGIQALSNDGVALTGLVIGLGVLGTGVAYVLYYFIVGELGAIKASGVTYLPPVVAVIIGVLLIGEPIRGLDLLAMAIILVGVILLQSARQKQEVAPPKAGGSETGQALPRSGGLEASNHSAR